MNLGVLVSQDCEAVRVSMIDGSCGPRVGCGVDQTLTKLSSPRLTFDRALVVPYACDTMLANTRQMPLGPRHKVNSALHLSGSLNRVPASAGVRSGMSPQPGGR